MDRRKPQNQNRVPPDRRPRQGGGDVGIGPSGCRFEHGARGLLRGPEGHHPRDPLLPGGTGPQFQRILADDEGVPDFGRPESGDAGRLAQQRPVR